MALINRNYFKSKDIKAYPSSFRGSYQAGPNPTDPTISFDPESRLNTEANFILPKTTLGKTKYIVHYDTTAQKIVFVLGGYTFEILNINTYLNDLKDKYIGILLREITLQDPSNYNAEFAFDSARKTKILASYETASNNILDVLYEPTQTDPLGTEECYYFTGLKVLDTASATADAKIKLFTADGSLNRVECLPNIEHGSGENTLTHGLNLVAAHANQTVVGKYNKNKTDSLFEVGCGTADNASSRKNALEISSSKTTINTGDTDIIGNTKITGNLQVTQKVTSNMTTVEDDEKTLTTKSYVDAAINNLDVAEVGEAGKYLKTISETNGKITATPQNFETVISAGSTNDNAPTAKAVNDFVTSTIADLDVDEIGGSSTYIQRISETEGKISATSRSFSNIIDENSDDTTAPTAKAVYTYIENTRDNLEEKMSNDIDSAIGNLDVPPAGQAGSYIKEIKQNNGKIEPTLQAFDNSINSTSTNDNAPTSKGVYDFVSTAIANIWTTVSVEHDNPLATTNPASLKDIILEATYPVGSIYMQYVSSNDPAPKECPIKTTLGGNWEQITAGKFLRAASDNTRGSEGGTKDAIIVAHSHGHQLKFKKADGSISIISSTNDTDTITTNFELTTATAGAHTHTTNIPGAEWGTGDITGFDGRRSDGKHENKDWISDQASDHTHTVTLPEVQFVIDSAGSSGTDKNLPPYLTVYMWRRKS